MLWFVVCWLVRVACCVWCIDCCLGVCWLCLFCIGVVACLPFVVRVRRVTFVVC